MRLAENLDWKGLKNVRGQPSAPGFDFRLEQRHFVLFCHNILSDNGRFAVGHTQVQGLSRQCAGKVFGNDAVLSNISILLQKVPLTGSVRS
jgi:hypothetical protein